MTSQQVIVYIDGFNLYYGAVKGTPFRWLNVDALCRQLLRPTDKLNAIKYYTALVSARPNDPQAPNRQQMYLRALETIPHLSIYYGHFLSHAVRMRTVSSLQPGQTAQYIEVMKTEEKGSDVNLATHLIHDAHLNRFTLAIVISNDSDLIEPIRIIR
ncbi:MAG: NYN domain-containing protein [candidate division Zixibacteria bacterium]|nr:NYN domain-containing protein [candidate division Zixibacteria bacterium]MDH3937155.1 NYN domain-containing protein [candidate division Zixibacteria bacterium]MDH4035191.1 NYN domain-containing protein [candidate division Zixibacteria bacterium]